MSILAHTQKHTIASQSVIVRASIDCIILYYNFPSKAVIPFIFLKSILIW